jgi:hypothetical protein
MPSDVAAIDLGAVADLGDVALCLGEDARKSASSAIAGFAEELGGELEDAAGVGDDLHGFDAGDLVEEPAAAGVHELGVAFELEEFEDAVMRSGGELAGGVLARRSGRWRRGAVEDDLM